MLKINRTSESLNSIISNHLKRRSLRSDNPAWEVKRSQLGGFGVFATRPIEVGEVIFKDSPVILGPRAALTTPITCVICYQKGDLEKCSKGCGLPFCSVACQNSQLHEEECKIIKQWMTQPLVEETSFTKLTKVLTPIRFLTLSDEDKEVVSCLQAHQSERCGSEVELMKNDLNFDLKEDDETSMRYVCAVLEANAFEVIIGNEENQSSVRGLYPLSSLINHCCTPNTVHVFDENHYMTVRASVFIDKDTEIFHSYARSIWGTSLRRLHLLRTKKFCCKCVRCEDPTEFGSYIGAILCKTCKGCVIPKDPLSTSTEWQCKECGLIADRKDVAMVTSLLGSVLNSFSSASLEAMLKFMEEKLPELVPEMNQTMVELKYRAIWILGYYHNVSWAEMSETLLLKKEKYCADLLTLLKVLRLGQCKIRGLLLYELYCCRRERNMRNESFGITSKNDNEMESLLDEAADILMYDVSAPTEVKQRWGLEKNGIAS